MTTLDFERVRRIRAESPEEIAEVLAGRRRRTLLPADGRLLIVAADHPARGALGVGTQESAMANRYELLERLVEALSRPGVDGVLATADIVEDLALLGALDGKVVVGSVNRGGLRGAEFELDDRVTGYGLESLENHSLDAVKILLRVDPLDAGSLSTLEMAARLVDVAAAARLPVIIEPFLSRKIDRRVVNQLDADSVIRSVAIASALGATSAWTWLKLPAVEAMEQVMEATTLPTLILGGDPVADPEKAYAAWGNALSLPGVRGLMVGRSLLYPSRGGVSDALDAAVSLVHPQLA